MSVDWRSRQTGNIWSGALIIWSLVLSICIHTQRHTSLCFCHPFLFTSSTYSLWCRLTKRSGPSWTLSRWRTERKLSSLLLPVSHHPHPPHEIRQACPLCFLSWEPVPHAGEVLMRSPARGTGSSSSVLYTKISLSHSRCTWKCLWSDIVLHLGHWCDVL